MSVSTVHPTDQAEDFEFEALQHARNYRNALVREFQPYLRSRILEVGAGVGHMTEVLLKVPSVSEVVAIEPERRYHDRLRQILPAASVRGGSARDVHEDRWNAIVCVNVLEHIEDDTGELAAFCGLLRKDQGHLCLFVPARQEIYAPIDRDFGHFRRYAKPALREKLQDAGFEIVRLNYFNLIGYFLWWLNFKLLKTRRFDRSKVIVFDRFIFPVVHAVESNLMYPPLGQSLLVVAKARR